MLAGVRGGEGRVGPREAGGVDGMVRPFRKQATLMTWFPMTIICDGFQADQQMLNIIECSLCFAHGSNLGFDCGFDDTDVS